MASTEAELEQQLKEAEKELSHPPNSVDELLPVLDADESKSTKGAKSSKQSGKKCKQPGNKVDVGESDGKTVKQGKKVDVKKRDDSDSDAKPLKLYAKKGKKRKAESKIVEDDEESDSDSKPLKVSAKKGNAGNLGDVKSSSKKVFRIMKEMEESSPKSATKSAKVEGNSKETPGNCSKRKRNIETDKVKYYKSLVGLKLKVWWPEDKIHKKKKSKTDRTPSASQGKIKDSAKRAGATSSSARSKGSSKDNKSKDNTATKSTSQKTSTKSIDAAAPASKEAGKSEAELEQQLTEAAEQLLHLPNSVDELLPVLDQVEKLLSKVDQSPKKSMLDALKPTMRALIEGSLLQHSDVDVKVAVASCFSEITRITAPAAPYTDDRMRDVFQLIVSSFDGLADQSSRSYYRRSSILETVSNVRSYIVMLDLGCEDLIVEMFEHFFRSVRDDHPESIYSSMENIMVMVLKVSEETTVEMVKPILASVKKNDEGVVPIAQKLGEGVLLKCAALLKHDLMRAIVSIGDTLDMYTQLVASVCEGTTATIEHNDENASVQLSNERKSTKGAESSKQSGKKGKQPAELEQQLKEAGEQLLHLPNSVDELLPVLNQLEKLLSEVYPYPNKSMVDALKPSMTALIQGSLSGHSDVDVKVAVASCISEITRITVPDAPYTDDQMREAFKLIVSSFEGLADRSSRSYNKRLSILETVSKVRSCFIMVDLECDGLIVEMFEHFFRSVRDYHPKSIYSSMESIMVMVLEESEETTVEMLKPILASVKNNNEGVVPIARKLGEGVILKCAALLKHDLMRAIVSIGDTLDMYTQVVASVCEGTTATIEHNDENASVQLSNERNPTKGAESSKQSGKKGKQPAELEQQLKEAGEQLLHLPNSVDELLPVLNQVQKLLSEVDPYPKKSMVDALKPSMTALIQGSLSGHSDVDVKVAVAQCISEITRITAPDAPYTDDQMREAFQLIVSSFEGLADRSSRSYNKRLSILETVSKVRSCYVMLDLECNGLIVEMFEHFLRSVRDYHPKSIYSSMKNIMVMVLEVVLVLEESEVTTVEMLKPILASVKKKNEGVLPIARKLGEGVLLETAAKLKPCMRSAMLSIGDTLDMYPQVVASICEETSVEHNDENASVEHNDENASVVQLEASDRLELEKKKGIDEKGEDSEETEDDEVIWGIEDENKKGEEYGVSKRINEPSVYLLSSPYDQKQVSISHLLEDSERMVSNRIFVRTGNSWDKVFETKKGVVLLRGMIETLQPGERVHTDVIDAWCEVLNFEEKSLKKGEEMRRYFFDTTVLRPHIYDSKKPFIERCNMFEERIKEAMKTEKELLTFEEVDLVFFPVHNENHYYLICINIKQPSVHIVDNQMTDAEIEDAYKGAPGEVMLMFSRYLVSVKHQSALQLASLVPTRLKMPWRTTENYIDCGVFCMRHLETYMGENEGEWSCGFEKEPDTQKHELDNLRIKYLTKILLCEINIHRKRIQQQSLALAEKSDDKIKLLLAEGWKKRVGRVK